MNKGQLDYLRQAFDELEKVCERRDHVRSAIDAKLPNPKVEIASHGRHKSFDVPLAAIFQWCQAEVAAAENVVKERGGEP